MLDIFKQYVDEEPILRDTADQLSELHDALTKGNISVSEYQELVQDITDLSRIDELSDNIENKVLLEQTLNLLKNVASALPII